MAIFGETVVTGRKDQNRYGESSRVVDGLIDEEVADPQTGIVMNAHYEQHQDSSNGPEGVVLLSGVCLCHRTMIRLLYFTCLQYLRELSVVYHNMMITYQDFSLIFSIIDSFFNRTKFNKLVKLLN